MKIMVPSIMTGLAFAGLVVACAPEKQKETAQNDYREYCVACHGAGGRGDPQAATDPTSTAPDLTMLSKLNGGVFPTGRVMEQLAGYTMGRSESRMPVFDALGEGPVIPYDDGSGQRIPTPARLAALTDYLRSIQQ